MVYPPFIILLSLLSSFNISSRSPKMDEPPGFWSAGAAEGAESGADVGGFIIGGPVVGGFITGGFITGGFITGGFITGGFITGGPDDGGPVIGFGTVIGLGALSGFGGPAIAIGFGGPEIVFGGPDIGFGGPDIVFGGPEIGFGGPDIVFGGPEIGFGGPDFGAAVISGVAVGAAVAGAGVSSGFPLNKLINRDRESPLPRALIKELRNAFEDLCGA